jgi:hypothetical protein
MCYTECKTESELLEKAKKANVYPFNQGDDWTIWRKGGVCDAISIDWIRRQLLSKKPFNDNKFKLGWMGLGQPGRSKLSQKHVNMSHLFREAKQEQLVISDKDWVQPTFDKFTEKYNRKYENVKDGKRTSGLENLQAELGYDPTQLGEDRSSRKGYLQSRINSLATKVADKCGIKIVLTSKAEPSGHSIAGVLKDEQNGFKFFDPNLGEYAFNDAAKWAEFVEALWYLKYPELTTIYPISIWLKKGD